MNNKERRIGTIELREADDSGKMIIEGYAAIFDRETLIGSESWGFYERIDRNAFDGANMKDVCLKYNHSDGHAILARTRNKSLSLSVDDTGLFVHAELLDTQDAVDMYKRIKSGLVDKMSFAFTIAEGGEKVEQKSNEKTPHRTITKFDRIFDVSVVDIPAYEETSIYARSLELASEWKKEQESNTEKRDFTISNLIKQYNK